MLKAQNKENTVVLSGVIIDAKNFNPLPYTHITKNHRQGMAADKNGRFAIAIDLQDTIEISYVGYHHYLLNAQEKQQPYIVISLEPAVRLLEEIEVRFMPMEKEFKKAVVMLRPSRQEIHARNNILLLQWYAAVVVQPADDIFANHPGISGPAYFTFFTSRGPRGVAGFIKSFNMMHNTSPYLHLKPYPSADDLSQNIITAQNLTDSLTTAQQDSLLTKKSLPEK